MCVEYFITQTNGCSYEKSQNILRIDQFILPQFLLKTSLDAGDNSAQNECGIE